MSYVASKHPEKNNCRNRSRQPLEFTAFNQSLATSATKVRDNYRWSTT